MIFVIFLSKLTSLKSKQIVPKASFLKNIFCRFRYSGCTIWGWMQRMDSRLYGVEEKIEIKKNYDFGAIVS